nr:hypothetical protein [Tanacetum cinerariifolium]
FVSENSNVDIESFSPSPIPAKDNDSRMKEIDLFLTPDDPMPPGIEEDDYNSERDILIREELLDNYSLSLSVIESYHFDIPLFSRPTAKPPDGIDKTDCDPEEKTHFIKILLYDNSFPCPPKEFVSKNYDAAIESFSPSPIPSPLRIVKLL